MAPEGRDDKLQYTPILDQWTFLTYNKLLYISIKDNIKVSKMVINVHYIQRAKLLSHV